MTAQTLAAISAVSESICERSAATHAYDAFAKVYDEHFGRVAFEQLRSSYLRILCDPMSDRATILDLCCGTGCMAKALSEEGFDVTGVDNSPGMLELARKRSPLSAFVQADARSFEMNAVDAVICTFNSMSHFCVDDLQLLFGRTAANLRPGGIFVFDTYAPAAYEELWTNSYSAVEEDYACFVRSSYDSHLRLGRNEIHLFEKQFDGWHRRRISLQMHAHSPKLLRKSLGSFGFRTRTFDLSSDPLVTGGAGHLLFLCSKVSAPTSAVAMQRESA
jgi:SAM-dependent methyltransferase